MRRLPFPCALGLSLLASACGDPPPEALAEGAEALTISDEIELDPPLYGHAAGDQLEPAVASLGGDFLAVWTDTRDEWIPPYPETSLWSARISPGGVALDPAATRVAFAPSEYVESPRAAGGPSGALVVYTRRPYDSTSRSIWATRLDGQGKATGSPISVAPASANAPRVAFGGSNYLVVWYQGSAPRAARIDTSGAKLDATALTPLSCDSWAEVAYGAGVYLVVGSCGNEVRGRLVGLDGTLQGASDFVIAPVPAAPRVAFDGTSFVVALDGVGLSAVRVTPGGAVLDAPVPVSSAGVSMDIASSGNGVSMITWREGDGVRGSRFSAAGAALDPAGMDLLGAAPEMATPVVGAAGDHFLVARKRNDNDYSGTTFQGRFDIEGVRVSSAGSLAGPPSPVAVAANGQVWPSAAFDGTNHLVVWEDFRNGDWDVYGALVGEDGVPLGESAIPIAVRPLRQARPVVAFGSGHYLVAWMEGNDGDLYVQRVAPNGTVTGGALKVGLTGHPAEFLAPDLAIAASSSKFLLAYEDYELGSGIRGLLLGPNGNALGPNPSVAPSNHYNVAVTSDGTGFLVAFNGNGSNTFFTRVSDAGTVVQGSINVSDTGGSVDATFDGDNYLVTWGGGAVRVTPDGALLDLEPIDLGSGYVQGCAAAADGTGFTVAWRDEGVMFMSRIGADGTQIGSSVFVSSVDDYYDMPFALSGSSTGRILAVYPRFADDADHNIRRVRARLLTSDELPPGTGGAGGGTPTTSTGGAGGAAPSTGGGGAGDGPPSNGADAAGDEDGGCGCRAAGTDGPRSGSLAAGLVALLATWWARRRARRAPVERPPSPSRASSRRTRAAAVVAILVSSSGCAGGEDGPSDADDDGDGGGAGPGACSDERLDCNGNPSDGCETDTLSHAQHCGACGVTCGGGACSSGACQPFAVAPVPQPDDLAVRGGSAYLSYAWNGWISEIELTPKATPASFGVGYYPDQLAVSGPTLVFSTEFEAPNRVVTTSNQGVSTQVIASGTQYYADLAVAGDRAVWLDPYTGALLHTALTGAETSPVSLPATSERLSANATHVAYREPGAIALLHLASSYKAILAEGPALSHPAVTDEHVFWVQGGALVRWSFADGSTVTLATDLGPVEHVAVTRGRVHLAAGATLTSVDRADGANPVTTSADARGMVGDADGITWMSGGVLYHLADPDPAAPAAPACNALFADCNGDAADGCEASIWSDPAHCGACGRTCDGPCAMGACQPTVLSSDFAGTTFALLGDELVFSTTEMLASMPKVGGPAKQIAASGYAHSFAVEGPNLYFCLDDNIHRYTQGSSAIFPVASAYGPFGLAVSSGTLFFGSSEDVYRVPATGGTPTLVFDGYSLDQDFVFAVAASGPDLFVATDSFYYGGHVFKVPALGGGSPQSLLSDQDGTQYSGFSRLLADGANVYAGHDNAGLSAVAKTGGPSSAWLPGEGVSAIAQDAERVYWVASKYHPDGGHTTYRLVRAAKSGGAGTVETLAELAQGSAGLAVDDSYVYFDQYPLLLRLPK